MAVTTTTFYSNIFRKISNTKVIVWFGYKKSDVIKKKHGFTLTANENHQCWKDGLMNVEFQARLSTVVLVSIVKVVKVVSLVTCSRCSAPPAPRGVGALGRPSLSWWSPARRSALPPAQPRRRNGHGYMSHSDNTCLLLLVLKIKNKNNKIRKTAKVP